MTNGPLISIIVPVYNAGEYLPKCLESLISQTYTNIEVICVNDGSTDNSLAVIKNYSFRDDRILVTNVPNGGVSKARNIALNQSKGEFVMFVDADDWIDNDTCEIALKTIIQNKADVVIWAYKSERKNHSEIKRVFKEDRVFDDVVKSFLHRRFIGIVGNELRYPQTADSLCPVWGKLYRRNVIKGVGFVDLNKIGTYEDGLFNMYVFERVDKAVYLATPLYHYRRENTESITNRYREQLYSQWMTLYRTMYRYIKSNHLPEEYYDALYNRIALGIIGLGLNILASNYSLIRKISMIKEMLNKRMIKKSVNHLDYSYFPIHWRAFFILAKYNCSYLFYFMLRMVDFAMRRKI